MIAAARDVDAERTEALVFELTAAVPKAMFEPRDVEALRTVLAVDAVPAVIAAAIEDDAELVFALTAAVIPLV